ncbi:MAG: ABC transporter ATP-binding protein [Gammaproteobacteria bacterium]|nr:ABC transporter ATP-binding protein [Gammaproteobacteria bacterium]
MSPLIKATGLSKSYGSLKALDNVDFSINAGRIVGLIGPNGAGKTTAIKTLLGLTNFDGDLNVCGLDPRSQRHTLMQQVSFIADVAVLPGWMKASEALDFVEGVHPAFNRQRALEMLALTQIPENKKIKQLSKGMITQLHLALVLAIDAKVLVLDEPTLGLDILYRKAFYDHLLNDYFDEDRTIIITTHQVDEIEYLLTDLLFINEGKIVLDIAMDEIGEQYLEVMVDPDQVEQARSMNPLTERAVFGRHLFLFKNTEQDTLASLGEIQVPKVTDLFVAKMKGDKA